MAVTIALMQWRALYDKYARLFWALHSAWALLSGIAVLVLAHNRHGFARWVILFIALTWGSTLVVSRFSGASQTVRFAQGFASYLTRVMYQETLFFLLPFYFYSATFPSRNFLYVLALAAFAVLSCFDMLFDRLLRERRPFAIGFFAFVSFSALQFFLPVALRMRIDNSELIAAAIAAVAALALAAPVPLRVIAFTLVTTLLGAWIARPLIPPVPLRMTGMQTGGSINKTTLKTSGDPSSRLYVVATVFSPERIPARVEFRYVSNGKVLRTSREVSLNPHRGGFRVWDSVRLTAPGNIRIELWAGSQLLGMRTVRR
jgi:hypothetical protein